MPEGRGKKRTYISISWSDSEEYDSSDEDEVEVTSTSTCCDDDDNDDDDDDESGSEWSDDKGDESDDQEFSDLDNDESLCNNVIRLLREKSDLQELMLNDCKSYLRQHGLRITGTKSECIQRIMEHWRIKDGNAEALYPKSSFAINCTGDVCKGDVVLFTQEVYKKFDKVTRSGSFLGTRTIAGRVVKESYGAAKQQHTFTIEVLWCKGIKKLPPLFPLLVKGRNLYKLRTFRQRWKNETERRKVLAEKHKRGVAARLARAMKKSKKECSKNGGVKRQKHFHHARPSQAGKKAEQDKGKRGVGRGKAPMECVKSNNHHQDKGKRGVGRGKAPMERVKSNNHHQDKGKRGVGRGKAPIEHVKSNNHHQKAPPVGRANLKKSSKPRAPISKPSGKHQNLTHPNKDGDPTIWLFAHPPQNIHQSQMQFHHHQHHHQWSAPFHLPNYEAGSTSSTMRNLNRSSELRTFMDCQNHFPWGRRDGGGAF